MPDPILNLMAEIVASYGEGNRLSTGEVPDLISSVHEALAELANSKAKDPVAQKPVGAISKRKSLADPNRILSMIDGKPYSSLTRHIKGHGFTPQSYREAFDLPQDYPRSRLITRHSGA